MQDVRVPNWVDVKIENLLYALFRCGGDIDVTGVVV